MVILECNEERDAFTLEKDIVGLFQDTERIKNILIDIWLYDEMMEKHFKDVEMGLNSIIESLLELEI